MQVTGVDKEKKFKCDHEGCTRAFNNGIELKIHKKTHETTKVKENQVAPEPIKFEPSSATMPVTKRESADLASKPSPLLTAKGGKIPDWAAKFAQANQVTIDSNTAPASPTPDNDITIVVTNSRPPSRPRTALRAPGSRPDTAKADRVVTFDA